MSDETPKGGRGVCKYCGTWQNNVSFHSAHDCPMNKRAWEVMSNGTMVQGAPQWLKDQMERQREYQRLHPPTKESIQRQFAASAKWRKENRTKCDRHPEYKSDQKPQSDCHDCWDVYHAQNLTEG